MPQEHRKYLVYNPESFMARAREIGGNAEKVFTFIDEEPKIVIL